MWQPLSFDVATSDDRPIPRGRCHGTPLFDRGITIGRRQNSGSEIRHLDQATHIARVSNASRSRWLTIGVCHTSWRRARIVASHGGTPASDTLLSSIARGAIAMGVSFDIFAQISHPPPYANALVGRGLVEIIATLRETPH